MATVQMTRNRCFTILFLTQGLLLYSCSAFSLEQRSSSYGTPTRTCGNDVSCFDLLSPALPRVPSVRAGTSRRHQIFSLASTTAGADIEQPPLESSGGTPTDQGSTPSSIMMTRPKVNEVDFCIAPADVSLSRAYNNLGAPSSTSSTATTAALPVLSLTRALNDASNRAVRRILLARSWPSAEALNESLRLVRAAQEKKQQDVEAKCPVPRPILNILTRKRKQAKKELPPPRPRSRTDQEYVADQLKAFQDRYGELEGYQQAEDYLDSVLSLATSGLESDRVPNIMKDGVYDEAYRRILAVLQSVGVTFEATTDGHQKISSKLIDQDICLSVLDKIQLGNKKAGSLESYIKESSNTTIKDVSTSKKRDEAPQDDLGAVLLSAKEPTITRQLNVLSNIVQRALLFGGDQELIVLSETLSADRTAFVERWYPGTGKVHSDLTVEDERRPGLQYLNCLIQLLRDCKASGVVRTLDPPLPLAPSWANAYERLVARSVELGSGYIKPIPSDVMDLPKPRTAQEELGRFAVWESTFRSSRPDVSAYPEDLVGRWAVRDVISGNTIGSTTVTFDPEGKVTVPPPLEGLRWRLDAGPAHLDTCSFQVLNNDGTILQYRGFIDRGARLEARFSKRPLEIRGSVMFQMRDGRVDYYKDMLPINYREGTTKFIMTNANNER